MPGQLEKNKFCFESKAKTLETIAKLLHSAIVFPQFNFTVEDWQKRNSQIIGEITANNWLTKKLVVRSSALFEDGISSSAAGHFDSVLNVDGLDNLRQAIEQVIKSFHDDNPDNQIFIQEMLENVKISGVVFTRDPNNNSPYIIINYDDKSGKTDTVTSGSTNDLKTFYCHRLYKKQFGDFRDKIFSLIFELENITNLDSLDIEFAIDHNGNLYLFQVRPLITNHNYKGTELNHYEVLQSINVRLQSWMKQHPYLCGKNTIYGVMPDWNPAEIIGIRPNPLSISLYREVITNSIWAYQRDNYGYRNLRSFPLLVEFEGMPYIDIRVSFNSFVPASLDQKIADKLVNYYLEKLADNPALHDKVEFEIVLSCFTFDFNNKAKALVDFGFSGSEIEEIKKSLLDLTNNIISNENDSRENSLWKNDLAKIEILKNHHQKIINSDLDNYSKMYWLIEDCKRYGTLPFAGLARAGFIAVEILKSLVKQNLMGSEEYDNFLSSLNTISSEIGRDFINLSKDKFLEKYGHLRPGTYDILSKRYDEDSDNYFNWNFGTSNNFKEKFSTKNFKLTADQLKNIQTAINNNGLKIDVVSLFDFIKGAIEAREYSKFIFTKNLSDFLKIYESVCIDLGISKEDAAYTHAQSILSLNSITSNPKNIISSSIDRRKKRFETTKYINLPPLIISPDDIFNFHEFESYPNYVTQKKVSGEVKILNRNDRDITDKIVMIQSADPGYDWIFSHQIKGLITKYGGVNSHMAIRAGELGIPSIIGAGKYYDIWEKSKQLEIDCLNKKVISI